MHVSYSSVPHRLHFEIDPRLVPAMPSFALFSFVKINSLVLVTVGSSMYLFFFCVQYFLGSLTHPLPLMVVMMMRMIGENFILVNVLQALG